MLILYALIILILLGILVAVWLVLLIESNQESPMFSYLDAQHYVETEANAGEVEGYVNLVEPFEYYSWEDADRQLIEANEQEHIDRMHEWAENSLAEEAQLSTHLYYGLEDNPEDKN